MKLIFIFLIIISSALSSVVMAEVDIHVSEKWKLYESLDAIDKKLYFSQPHQKQIDKTYKLLLKSYQALKNISSVYQPAKIKFNFKHQLDMGEIPIGKLKFFEILLENIGEQKATGLEVTGLSYPLGFVGGEFPGLKGTCSDDLEPGKKCSLFLQLSADQLSSRTVSLKLNYFNSVNSVQNQFKVNYKIVEPALLVLSRHSYNFFKTTIGAKSHYRFQVFHRGGYIAQSINFKWKNGLSKAFVIKNNPDLNQKYHCQNQLVKGQECEFLIEFQPQDDLKNNATLLLEYNNGVSTQHINLSLIGRGQPPGQLLMSQSDPFRFKELTLGDKVNQIFEIKNIGLSSISEIKLKASGRPFSVLKNKSLEKEYICNNEIAPGTMCNIVVSFSPTARGINNGQLKLSYFDGAKTKFFTKNLLGVSVLPAFLVFNESPLFNFGSNKVNTSTSKLLTVTNVGESEATNLNFNDKMGPFYKLENHELKDQECGPHLQQGKTCVFGVEFRPENEGVFSDTLQVFYEDGLSLQVSSVDLLGVGRMLPSHEEPNPNNWRWHLVGIKNGETSSVNPVELVATGILSTPGVSLEVFADALCQHSLHQSVIFGNAHSVVLPMSSEGDNYYYVKTTSRNDVESACTYVAHYKFKSVKLVKN